MDARDFAVINAVMDDFTKDYVMLDGFIAVLGTGTLFLRVKDEVSECKNFNKLADGLLENNVYPSRLDSLVPTSSLWRLEKEGDDGNRLERKIGTFVNITRPAYDIDGKSAAVFLTFSMGMHGDSGYYVLTENNDNWKIECKTFRFGL